VLKDQPPRKPFLDQSEWNCGESKQGVAEVQQESMRVSWFDLAQIKALALSARDRSGKTQIMRGT